MPQAQLKTQQIRERKQVKAKQDFTVVLVHLNGTLNMTSAGLHAFLEKSGYKVFSVFFRELNFLGADPPTKEEVASLVKVLKELNPDIIGMSVQSMSFWDCADLTQELKKNFSCPVMWGGIQPMIDPVRCLEYANIIIRGEAEGALIELFEKMRQGENYASVKNLWIKDKKNTIHKNNYRELIQDLDTLPFPDYTDKNKIYIIKGIVYHENPIPHYKYGYNLTTSRGCPMRCTFCFEHVLNREFKFKYLRRRTVDNVIAELREALRLYPKIEEINFWDNIFTMDREWVKDFAVKYKMYVNKPFFCYGHSSLIKDPEMIQALADAGLKHIFLGMQTGSEKIRREIYKRSETNEDLLRAARIIKKYAPKAELRFDTIMSGFETPETLREGIQFLLTLPKPFKTNRNSMAYYLDFEITRMALEQGLIKEEDIASINRNLKSQVASQETAEKNPFVNYYYLLGRKFIPNAFIRFCLNRRIETKHPKAFSKIYLFFEGMDVKMQQLKRVGYLVKNGEFSYLFKRIFR